MTDWAFTKGVHDLGDNCWAYLQPDGSWGWSNAGFITDSGDSLLVDTLFDLKHTAEMLAALRRAIPTADRIDTLLNTHRDGDHTFGNQLVEGARILTTKIVADILATDNPDRLAKIMNDVDRHAQGARFMREVMAPFDFSGIVLPPVTDTFEGSLNLKVGNKDVRLIDVGPAHTASDTLVFVPDDKVVYTGDILFVGGHPALWGGPISNWIAACDLILSWDVETIVPGHGPIVGKPAVAEFRDYLVFLKAEARRRYDAGMGFEEAAHDLDLGRYDGWADGERTVANFVTLWGEFSGERPQVEPGELWGMMARMAEKRRADRLRLRPGASPSALTGVGP